MKKNKSLNQWLWKWHFIAGLISLPFIVILAITGGIYLFKADYEAPRQKHIKEVAIKENTISFEAQRQIATANATKKPNAMVIPNALNQATEFTSGRFSHKKSIYINPYSGAVTGKIIPKHTDMYLVRKLHGELLLGKFGTKIVELIASWMIILILTGLYVWWPNKGWNLRGYFIPRTKEGKRTFYRDLHAISGFWFSALFLLILAGGLPWTDVFGSNFKQLQTITNTGFPASWGGHHLKSESKGKMLTLDEIVTKAKTYNLSGTVSINFPKGPKGIYSISNQNPSDLSSQKKIHIDAYSGKEILSNDWKDVGVLMRARMWVMAFHQGEFGLWNWWLMLIIAIGLTMMSLSALISYVLRKRKGSWGTPKVPLQFKVGYGIMTIIGILGLVFPLFGISLLIIISFELLSKKSKTS